MNDEQAITDLSTSRVKTQTRNWIAFTVCGLACIGLFFIPAFIIRPFTHQSARGLLLAMAVKQHAPLLTLLTALACTVLAWMIWSKVGRWRKALLVLCMVPVVFSAVMARMNYFEWMFHPVVSPGFEAEEATKLDGKEMVLAVKFGPDARAYPISQMAYHHIVNDVVGGVPIAATY